MYTEKNELVFYQRPTLEVAKDLLGRYLVRNLNNEKLVGKIVEVEAYIGEDDSASHASVGRTNRNSVMYQAGGIIYVYFIYGMYYCLNIVTEHSGFPSAILIRALEPISGIETMRINRRKNNLVDLTSGPGKLCEAMAIDRSFNGKSLTDNQLYISNEKENIEKIVSSGRIGIRQGVDKQWRFFLRDNRYVSNYKVKNRL